MLVVSLTGGIASGKSTASKAFSAHGIPLIDLDVLARQVVEPGDASGALDKLVAHFGRDILQADGKSLDRAALGRRAFGTGNEEDRKVLNKITHLAIRKRMAWLLFKHWAKGTPVVIVDTPLAVEAGLWRLCGEMVLVWAPPETQLKRMLKRDASKGLTEEDANHRLNSQLPLADKVAYADVVLDNADDLPAGAENAKTSLEKQVDNVVKRWQREHVHGLGRVRTWLQLLVPPVGIVMAIWAIFSRARRVAKKKRQRAQEVREQ